MIACVLLLTLIHAVVTLSSCHACMLSRKRNVFLDPHQVMTVRYHYSLGTQMEVVSDGEEAAVLITPSCTTPTSVQIESRWMSIWRISRSANVVRICMVTAGLGLLAIATNRAQRAR